MNQEYLDVELTVDKLLNAGQFTTNCEQTDNIHWLKGIAEESVLFRFNMTGLPSKLPDYDHIAGRLYVDPSEAIRGSVIRVPFISKDKADTLSF